MIQVRKSAERGHFNFGWLDTYHTFSFADYYDPQYMGFRSLRVINEDIVKPTEGFPTHAHQNMEIITYILEGELEHKDSMGTGSVIKPGEIQRMSAGKGVTHSEYNHSKEKYVHLLQIWILPEKKGVEPSYEQKNFLKALKPNSFSLIASGKEEKGIVRIHQNVDLFTVRLQKNKEITYQLKKNRYAWIQTVDGVLKLNQIQLEAGDGAAISEETALAFSAKEDSHFLLFDLA